MAFYFDKTTNFYFFKGCPTAIAQSCPGSPCGGLMPGGVDDLPCCPSIENVGGVAGFEVGVEKEGVIAGALLVVLLIVVVAGVVVGSESNGAPTGISQRCPGSPWGGFNFPEAALLEAAVLFDPGKVSSIISCGSLPALVSLALVVFAVSVVSWVSVLLQAIKVDTTIAKVTIFFIVVILIIVLCNEVKITNNLSSG